MPSPSGEITVLLSDSQQGNAEATSKLMHLVYSQLRRMAARRFGHERPDHTLQPTALVHEAYLRLMKPGTVRWKNRSHFFGIAARAMRQILVESARKRNAGKRGGGQPKINLDEARVSSLEEPSEWLALDEALARLQEFDPRQSQIVELRIFGGLSAKETAAALHVSVTTVKEDWKLAKAWLRGELERDAK